MHHLPSILLTQLKRISWRSMHNQNVKKILHQSFQHFWLPLQSPKTSTAKFAEFQSESPSRYPTKSHIKFHTYDETSDFHYRKLLRCFPSVHHQKVRRIESNQKLGKLENWNFPLALDDDGGEMRRQEMWADGVREFSNLNFCWLTGIKCRDGNEGNFLIFEFRQFRWNLQSSSFSDSLKLHRSKISSFVIASRKKK